MFERYAIFYTPTGALAQFGAAWLGWDSATGRVVPHPDIAGVDVAAVTATPRKYGLHGTLKAPFRLADTATLPALQTAVAKFAGQRCAFEIGAMTLGKDGGFVALRPAQDNAVLQQFAADIVTTFDPFRAPLSDAEIARRRQAPLTPRQDQQMLDWGYPFIFDDFHFHLTLSGSLPAQASAAVIATLAPVITPLVPDPFIIDAIALMGQDRDGMFHQIHRHTLSG